MADFKTGLSGPNTQFTQAQASKPMGTEAERDQLAANIGAAVATKAGKAYAESSAAALSGADKPLSEVNDEAAAIEEKINASLTGEQNRVGGPLQKQDIEEIKDIHLSEFADNDRTLLALRDRGVISTVEAQTRRALNLKRALSHPINSLFRKDFMNAAGSLTGGAGSTADTMFQLTPEEKQAKAIQEEQIKATAEYEGKVTSAMAITGKTRQVVVNEMAQQEEDQKALEQLNRIKTQRELTSIENSQAFALGRSGVSRGNSQQIAELNTANGGKGLRYDQMAALNQGIEDQFQKLSDAIDNAPGMTAETRKEEHAALLTWKTGQQNMVKAYDMNEIDAAELKFLDQTAQKIGWAATPGLKGVQANDPIMYKVLMESGNQLDTFINNLVGGEAGSNYVNAMNNIRSLSELSKQGGDITNPEVVMDFLNTAPGQDYLKQKIADDPTAAPVLSENMRKLYMKSTEKSLRTYSQGTTVMRANNGDNQEFVRNEVNNAMSIARDKADFIVRSSARGGQIQVLSEPKQHRDDVPVVKLHIPEGLKEYAGEWRQMYNVIKNHRWSWEHVQDDYFDAADAFNGYMRGEFDLNASLEEGVSKLKPTVPTDGTEIPSAVADPEAIKDMEAEMAREEAGVPTQTEEEQLVTQLEQRVETRDKKRTGGLPVDPRTQMPEQKKVEIGRHGDSNYNSISQKLFKFEGGFQNDPADKGNYVDGELIGTNLGISAAQYERLFGEKPTEEKMKALTKEQVDAAYKKEYWDANRVGEMPPELQEMAMNMFVMTSPKNVIKAIQRASGAKEDGILGPQTLKAMRGTTKEEIWEEYHKYLKSLKNYSKFGRGWKNRYEEILNA